MPLGMPQVPFEDDDDLFNFFGKGGEYKEQDWSDLYNKMYERGKLFLYQELNSEIANKLISMMLHLAVEEPDPQKPRRSGIELYINSNGGELAPGLMLFETMRSLNVTTINVSMAGSVASLILAGGAPGKRFSFPNSRVMMHQPASVFFDEKGDEYIKESGELLYLRNRVVKGYQERTRMSSDMIWKNLERDIYMSAEEAESFGIIDKIVKSRKIE